MKTTTRATVHYCDGCSTPHVQLDGEDLPTGFYAEVTEVTKDGDVEAGKLFVCSQKCLLSAFRRRREVWEDSP